MSPQYQKLISLLKELFQTDQAELDFGMYRIINQRRDEINCFLEEKLLPQIKDAFSTYQSVDTEILGNELKQAIQQAGDLGVDPETASKVKGIREKIATYSVDVNSLENQVYSALYNFFRRYYDDGDFISQRRYKEGVYAIPYEGEEVKLYWANYDQYYIKTSEYFRDYSFGLPSGKRAHFKLVEADTEKDNRKEIDDNKRRFVLADDPLAWQDGEVVIRFEFRPEKANQSKCNEGTLKTIFGLQKKINIQNQKEAFMELAFPTPTESKPERTLLEKHLEDYTRRNTQDYFIHKDLGKFLRRELDFYIKNEVMQLDNIENESAPRVEEYLSKIKVIRQIAHKIIDFLAQIEDFQKKLWLKKKFVVETNYCITLDRIPEELYPEIADNDAQREEWVRLFAIDKIKNDLVTAGYRNPLTIKFLKANPFLVLDTKFFDQEFKYKVLENIKDIDELLNGLLIQSDNFQALRLLENSYDNNIETIYIDPPYNTEKDRQEGKFLFKDNFESSTWLTQLANLSELSYSLLNETGSFFASCDENEFINFGKLLTNIFSKKNHVETIVWNKRVPKNDKGIGNIHEYIYLFAKNLSERRSNDLAYLMRKDGLDEVYDIVRKEKRKKTPLEETQEKLKQFYKKNDFDRGITLYCELDENYEIWGKINMSWPNPKSEGPRYEVINPVTNRPTPIPKNGWRWTEETFLQAEENGPEFILPDGSMMRGRIWYPNNTTTQPSSITYLKEVEAFLLRSILSIKSDGSLSLEGLGLGGGIDYPKSITLMERILYSNQIKEGYIIDFFAGSGTTGHAVINLNRTDGGNRKYLLIEMEQYFDFIVKPRIQKAIYSEDWKDGKPISRKGSSHAFKYMRLESYEDTLNNLTLKRSETAQTTLLDKTAFSEDYLLHYMLDFESQGSLLDLERFETPFDYQLLIASSTVGETEATPVDLVETFNYLLGLHVQSIRKIEGALVIRGTTRDEKQVLVIWRTVSEMDNDQLNDFFKTNLTDESQEITDIYVNGDNNLANIRPADQHWNVHLTEESFHRLMFEGIGS